MTKSILKSLTVSNKSANTVRDYSNNAYYMHTGPSRRKVLLNTIKRYSLSKDGEASGFPGLPVNNKWQWSSKDSDLQYLMKKGLLKQVRVVYARGIDGKTGYKKHGKSQTFLVLTTKLF